MADSADPSPLAWQSDAACLIADSEAFFPERGGSVREAKKVCETCPVRAQCLEYALENDEQFGVWGGLSVYERRKIKTKRIGQAATRDTLAS